MIAPDCSTELRKYALKSVRRTDLHNSYHPSHKPSSIAWRKISFIREREREVSTGLCLGIYLYILHINSLSDKYLKKYFLLFCEMPFSAKFGLIVFNVHKRLYCSVFLFICFLFVCFFSYNVSLVLGSKLGPFQ